MKRTKALLALSVWGVIGALAAACGSSSFGGSSPPNVFGASGSGGSGGFSGTSGGSSGGGRLATPVACGPTNTCSAPLNFCCVLDKESGGDGGEADAPVAENDSGDAGSTSDATNDAEAGSRDAARSVQDEGGGSDALSTHDAGDGGEDAAPDDAEAGVDANTATTGATYSCTSNASSCPTGSVVLGCTSYQNCPTNEACCGEFADGGLLASCAPAPCSGPVLCTRGADCAAGQACIPAIRGTVTYGTCGIGDAGPSDGGLRTAP